jgi:hypothetical protein
MRLQTTAAAAPRQRVLTLGLAALVLVLGAGLIHMMLATFETGRQVTVGSYQSAPVRADIDVVRIQIEHTLVHPIDGVVLNVERMDGHMVGKPGQLISLDDRNSFTVQIDQAVTRLSAQDLSALVNSYLLKQADSPVRHVDVSFDGQQAVIRGTVRKLIPLPFEGRGELSATTDGKLRLHMSEFRVAGVLTEGFLGFFGIKLDDLAQPKHRPSFRVEGDDFITDLNDLFPAPQVYGRLVRVHVEGQNLVQVIGVEQEHHALDAIPKALPSPANYIYFTGGRMKFGRMTMEPVELKLVDSTPQNAFDFSLDHYQAQIESGYVKLMPDLGAVVYAEDWSTLAAQQHK